MGTYRMSIDILPVLEEDFKNASKDDNTDRKKIAYLMSRMHKFQRDRNIIQNLIDKYYLDRYSASEDAN